MATITVNPKAESTEPEVNTGLSHIISKILILILVFGIVAFVYYQFTRSDVLPIQEITVSGEFNQLMSEDLQPIIADGIEGNFFTINVANLYQQLLALPWIEKVWIHRIWPNTIKVNVKEQQPVAILNNQGLINQNGQVFIQDSTFFKNKLPIFVVANEYRSEAVVQYQALSEIISQSGLDISKFSFDERKSQKLYLSNGIEIILGRLDVAERLIKFVKAYNSHLKHNKRTIETIDLRYTNGLAVSWKKTSARLKNTRS